MTVRDLRNITRGNIPGMIVDKDSMAGRDVVAAALRVMLRDRDEAVVVDQQDRNHQPEAVETQIVRRGVLEIVDRVKMTHYKKNEHIFGESR